MINITKIKCISNSYLEEIEGTHEWYYCREEAHPCNDLYDAHEIFNRDGLFKGIIHHLVHYPDGKVHSPFQIQNNIYVEKPIWNNGEINFLVVDFHEKIIRITKYIPENEKLEIVTELSLSEVEDCYNLMLETTPLTLGRSGNDGFYEIFLYCK